MQIIQSLITFFISIIIRGFKFFSIRHTFRTIAGKLQWRMSSGLGNQYLNSVPSSASSVTQFDFYQLLHSRLWLIGHTLLYLNLLNEISLLKKQLLLFSFLCLLLVSGIRKRYTLFYCSNSKNVCELYFFFSN